MNREMALSAVGTTEEKPPAETETRAAGAPPAQRLTIKRQLKDYPQSLQTAARALWG